MYEKLILGTYNTSILLKIGDYSLKNGFDCKVLFTI